MQMWNNLKIRDKITVSVIAISLVFTVLLVLASILSIRAVCSGGLKEKGSSLAIITAETVKAPVQYNVGEDVEKVLGQLLSSDSDVSVAAVVTQKPSGALELQTRKASGQHGNLDLSQAVKELGTRPPSKKGEAAFLDTGGPQNLSPPRSILPPMTQSRTVICSLA